MSPIAFSISFFVVVTTMIQVVGADEPPTAAATTGCKATYDNLTEAFNDVNANIFPTDKFNATCLAAACPALTSAPSPYLEGNSGPFNATAVNIILNTFTLCLRQSTILCCTPIKNIPACDTAITLPALFNSQTFDGSIKLTPGSGFVSGIQGATFEYNGTTGYVTINVTSELRGQFEGTVGNQNFSGLEGKATVGVSIVVLVDPAVPTYPVQVQGGSVLSIKVDFKIQGLRGNTGHGRGNSNVQKLIKKLVQLAEEGGKGLPIFDGIGTFYGTMLEYVWGVNNIM